jgi:hypothetical protein
MPNLRHKSEDTVTNYRGPSVNIFGDLDHLRQQAAMGQCVFYDNDFVAPPTLASATAQGEFYSYQDTNVTISGKGINDPDVELGVLDIDVLDTDNDEGSFQIGQTNQWAISNTAGNVSKFGYEVRFRVDELAANETCLLFGLLEGPVATATAVDDTGVLVASKSFLGFQTLPAAPTTLRFGFQDTGSSAIVVADATVTTLVEDTYVNVGFLYDNARPDAKKITAYVNGVAQSYITKTQIDTSTFPEDEGMVPFFLAKTYGSGTSGTASIDRITFMAYQDGCR